MSVRRGSARRIKEAIAGKPLKKAGFAAIEKQNRFFPE
jgi:hypothetical protein